MDKSQELNDRAEIVFEEMQAETERAAVILGAAEIDILLGEALEAYFLPPNNTSKKYGLTLIGPDESAGTFSARIELAYRLGLIPPWCQRESHMIRKIRNNFAHKPAGFKLEDRPVCDLVRALEVPSAFRAAGADDVPDDLKSIFIFSSRAVYSEIVCACQNLIDCIEPKVKENDNYVSFTDGSVLR